MIFAMVGMHSAGFDRLVEALDAYAGRHPEAEVVIQAGSSRYRPRHARAFAFKTDLDAELAAAGLVVSHGSIGFLDALRRGKRLVVVPRLARFGEVIDDHQVRFSERFGMRYGFPVVLDVAGLDAAIGGALASPAPAPIGAAVETGLHKELRAYLDGL